jgi:hypothetical protein
MLQSNLQFKQQEGYIGTIPIAGTGGKIDVWVAGMGCIPWFSSSDASAHYFQPVFVGAYDELMYTGIAEPLGITQHQGYAVATGRGATGQDVLRPNYEKVFASMEARSMKPWNLQAGCMIGVVDEQVTATDYPWWH